MHKLISTKKKKKEAQAGNELSNSLLKSSHDKKKPPPPPPCALYLLARQVTVAVGTYALPSTRYSVTTRMTLRSGAQLRQCP